ncbi:MAG: hypothetical protein HeimC3_20840 [Candidatus Heimdallarchaeota archaeon LC_3]|nr:MAG: hypothetical protein HeimC3_20840 [Candidatus Heimdallarchaeota archaeon LC_3]
MAVNAKLKLLQDLKRSNTEQLQKMSIVIDSIRSQITRNPKPSYSLTDINKYFDMVKKDTTNILETFSQEATKSLLAASRGKTIETTKLVSPIDQLSMEDLERIQNQINEIVDQYTKILQSYLEQSIELGIRERTIENLGRSLSN